MKANELRIGNYVNIDRIFKVPVIVTANTIQAIVIADDYKPIALSEEWLTKFGAYMESNVSILKLKNGDISYENGDILLCYGDYSESAHLEHIKYVHQLQNLYFALTNTELELKEVTSL